MNCSAQFVEAINSGGGVSQLAFKCQANTCTNGTFQLVTNTTLITSNYACSKFSPTPNCQSYNLASQGVQPITSVPDCATCLNNYYLNVDTNNNNAKSCQKRFVSSSNCTSQSANADTCTSLGCASGYYLTSGNFCTANPTGVYKCSVYDSTGTRCTTCQTGFYLDTTGNCSAITTVISQCVAYSNATTCSQCAQSSTGAYYLSSNGTACTASTITNCVQWTPAGDKCSQCAPGYYLSTDQ